MYRFIVSGINKYHFNQNLMKNTLESNRDKRTHEKDPADEKGSPTPDNPKICADWSQRGHFCQSGFSLYRKRWFQ